MERTLVVGDSIVSDMRYYRSHDPSRGDLVIIYRGKTYWIKRIVAIGGDIIQGFEGVIILNGKVLTEPYVEHIQVRSQLPELSTFGPVKIPAGEYFVMGDNRDVSYDSRSHDFGLLQADIIVGKPLYIIRSSAARIGTSLH